MHAPHAPHATPGPGPGREPGRVLTIVLPLFNEEQGVAALLGRLSGFLDEPRARAGLGGVRVCFVDDGSRDATAALLAEAVKRDPRLTLIRLSRNFGHQAAVSVGLQHATGDVVAVMDADGQDPLGVLPEMLAEIRAGADVAYGVRKNRQAPPLLKLCYFVHYRVLSKLVDVDVPLDVGDFCCMTRPVVDAINALPERQRYVRGLRSWVGFSQVGVPYDRPARAAGSSKYNLRRLSRLASDGLFAFSDVPIKVMQFLGLLTVSMAAFFGFVYLMVGLLAERNTGFPSVMISIWFLGGVQMICLGLIGEYAQRGYAQGLGRPVAVVREVVRAPAAPPAPKPAAASQPVEEHARG